MEGKGMESSSRTFLAGTILAPLIFRETKVRSGDLSVWADASIRKKAVTMPARISLRIPARILALLFAGINKQFSQNCSAVLLKFLVTGGHPALGLHCPHRCLIQTIFKLDCLPFQKLKILPAALDPLA
jgi:hypothetical protein